MKMVEPKQSFHVLDKWVVMEDGDEDDDVCEEFVTSINNDGSSSLEGSLASIESSSLEFVEDASSSTFNSSNGPLFEIFELMAHLPIKRGLSKYYEGKSQSFTSLANVKSTKDLAKRVNMSCKKKLKYCKSYGGGLDGYKSNYNPKPIITKRVPRSIF